MSGVGQASAQRDVLYAGASAGHSVAKALPLVASRLAESAPLRIIAFGSSSTEGVGAGSRDRRGDAVPVIRRFDLMRAWLDKGLITPAALMAEDGLHMADAGYAMLATEVARVILAAVHTRAPASTATR